MTAATERNPLSKAILITSRRKWSKDRVLKAFGRAVLYAMLALGAVVITLPTIWLVSSSLKSYLEIHSFPVKFLPEEPTLEAYRVVLLGLSGSTSMYPRWILNTIIIAVFVEIGTLISNSVVAFSFSRLRWRWRNTMFFFVLATMMLPGQVTMIPTYLVFSRVFKWVDTWYPQIIPAFFASAGSVFLLRQFMMTIPVEIDESARLDGCNNWSLFWRLILPMSKPALGAIAIFTFGYVWNDMYTPLLYIRERLLWNIAIAVSGLAGLGASQGQRFPHHEYAMAAAVVTTIPMIVLFFVFQKQYIQGVVITGVKG